MRIVSFAMVCSSIFVQSSLGRSLLCTARNFLSTYPCVSFRLIENTGAKRPVPVHGTAIDAAERTFSAARLSDILRGSYRLAPQSPASSQFPAGFLPFSGTPCASFISISYPLLIVKQNFSFFHKIFSGSLAECPREWPGHSRPGQKRYFVSRKQ